jgi:hypothetical protein
VTTTAPKSKACVKPSQQTQFVLDALDSTEKREDQRWEKMQESIDLLFSKLEAQEETQGQMAVQMELTAKAMTQSSQEQLALAQQLAATSEVVARLAIEKQQGDAQEVQGARGAC